MNRFGKSSLKFFKLLKLNFLEFVDFLSELGFYIRFRFFRWFLKFEFVKGFFVGKLYQQRGKYTGAVVHLSVVFIGFFGLTFGPSIVSGTAAADKLSNNIGYGTGGIGGQVLGSNVDASPVTVESDKPRAEIAEYTVQNGDTLSNIAGKFDVSVESIRWLNDNVSEKAIKPGQSLKIPPVSGIIHTVKSGETIYSVAKKYQADAQSIVDFPFNTFTNDETFSIAIGQKLVVPDGVMPEAEAPTSAIARKLTPDAGAVSATGSWSWPAAGTITQGFRPWHKAIDVARSSGGPILAADSGRVVIAGWPDNMGYGNRIVIDHGNGHQTLYAHLSKFNVVVGQNVKRGDVIGQMGSTGRSTGTHLHFEIRIGGKGQNPLDYLK